VNFRSHAQPRPTPWRHRQKALRAWKVEKPPTTAPMLPPVFGENDVHDIVLAVMGKVHVDVWQLVESHALLIQKTAEIEAEADRANIGDPQAIAYERVRRAAPGDPFQCRRAGQSCRMLHTTRKYSS